MDVSITKFINDFIIMNSRALIFIQTDKYEL